jgi:ATP-dependent RNA helicase RhlE
MPKAIADLGKQFINNPVRVEVTPQASTAERVDQFVTFVNQAEKQALLTLRIRALLADGKLDRALVFTRTKHGADRVVRNLCAASISARAIHGNKSQAQRTAALEAFRQGSCPILVATDIAARGIDVSGVSHVFNFELPNVPEQYVHRIGRTARAGADGEAVSFCAPDEKPYLRDIEKLTQIKLMPLPLPDGFLAEAARLPVASRKPDEAEQDARRDARDARGRSGNRGGGNYGGGERNGGERGGGQGRRDDRTPGGRAQGRDGRPRDANPRNAERGNDRGPVGNPVRAAAAPHAGQGERQPRNDRNDAPKDGQPRSFRPRGPGGNGPSGGGVGQHRNKVRRAV